MAPDNLSPDYSTLMNRIIIVFLLLYMAADCVSAQDSLRNYQDYTYHTSYQIGDTVAVYGAEVGVQSHLYIFADESSCFTCMMSIQPIISTIRSGGHTKATLFLRGASPEYIQNLSQKYEWGDFGIVDDRIGAYMDKYRIKNVPFYLLVDAQGAICDMGEVGSVRFDLKRLLSIVRRIEEEGWASLQQQPLAVLKRIPVMDGQQPLLAGRTRFLSYVPETGEYIILVPSSLSYAIADSGGVVKHKVDLENFEHFNALSPFPMSLTPTPGVLLGGDSDLETVERVLYYLDYIRDSLVLLHAPKNTDLYKIGFEYICTPDRRILIGLHPGEYAMLDSSKDFRTTMMLDSLGNPIRTFGAVPAHYREVYLDGFYWTAFACDEKGRIYQMHNLGDMVYVYTPEGVLTDSVRCRFDTTMWYGAWREKAAELNLASSLEAKKEFGEITSKLHSLLYDESRKNLYVVYTNRTLPGKQASTGKLYYYVHQASNSQSGPVHDIAIPNNGIPFHIDNDVLYTTELSADNSLEIVVYSLR